MWGLWVLDDTFPRSLGGSNEMDLTSQRALGSWGFISPLFGSVGSSLLTNSVSWIHCVNSPTNLVGVRQIWSESDKFGRSPTNLVGVRQIWSESDKFGRSPTKPRDWLALAAADVLFKGDTGRHIRGKGGIALLQILGRTCDLLCVEMSEAGAI